MKHVGASGCTITTKTKNQRFLAFQANSDTSQNCTFFQILEHSLFLPFAIMHLGSELLQVQNFFSFQKCHFWKCSDLIGIKPNTFHDFQKYFKSATFENYYSFVPAEIQNQCYVNSP